MNLEQAIQFVKSQGNEIEHARLRYILANEPPSPEVVARLFDDQRADGGWPPFWAQDYSSLDATCFRLAQAEQLGLGNTEPAVRQAARFLTGRQAPQGSWEEDTRVAGSAPPWAKPGELSAVLYLTANCGLWLALLDSKQERPSKAAAFLKTYLDERGRLPGFMHTHWLVGGLWHKLGWHELSERVFNFTARNVNGLAASELAWLLATLRLAGVKPDHMLAKDAANLLGSMQHEDGRWPSADGPVYDVHTTLEAMRVLWPR
jgi:hypothetical protein